MSASPTSPSPPAPSRRVYPLVPWQLAAGLARLVRPARLERLRLQREFAWAKLRNPVVDRGHGGTRRKLQEDGGISHHFERIGAVALKFVFPLCSSTHSTKFIFVPVVLGDVVSSCAGRAWLAYFVRVGTCAYMLLLCPPIGLDWGLLCGLLASGVLPYQQFSVLFSSMRALARVQTTLRFREDGYIYTLSLVAVVPDGREIGTCHF